MLGWYGGRVAVESEAAVVAVRHETAAQYRGRLDTSALSNIRDGHSVNIKVVFDAVRSNDYAYLDFGVGLASEGSLNGGDGISGASGRIDPETNGNASYTNIPQSNITKTFSNITNANRLSWVVSRDYELGNAFISRTWYVYLDNIRVSIAQ